MFPFADVLHLRDEIERCALSIAQDRNAEHDLNHRPALGDVALFAVVSGDFPTNEFTCRRAIPFEIVGMGDVLERASRQLSQSARLTRTKCPSSSTNAIAKGDP